MAPNSDSENPDQGPSQDDILKELEQIEERLLHDMRDPRMSHGVPKEQRGDDLDFIQMSGVTSPPQEERSTAGSSFQQIDPSQPLSFFEKGVKDVDAELAPGGAVESENSEVPLPSRVDSNMAMSHLRDIIAELTRETPSELNEATAGVESTSTVDALSIADNDKDTPDDEDQPEPSVPLIIEPTAEEEAVLNTPHETTAPVVMVAPVSTPSSEALEMHEVLAPEAKIDEAASSHYAAIEATPIDIPDVSIAETPIEAPRSADLIEAEQLMQLIEDAAAAEQDSDVASTEPTITAFKPRRSNGDESVPGSARKAEDSVYSKVGPRYARRRSRGKHRLKITVLKASSAAAAIVVIGFVAYQGYHWYSTHMSGPESILESAKSFSANGEYAKASDAYLNFATRHTASPQRADAQFAAAVTLQEIKPDTKDKAKTTYGRAIQLFEQFIKDNPTHPKVARAQIIMGRLNFEMDQYQEAIACLQDPELRLKDPIAGVPALRTLARSYAKMGDDGSARSYYLQSAGVADNHSPDVDFDELGSLYRSLAERATKPENRATYEQQALEQWTKASQVPGIDPSSKKDIRTKIDVLKEQIARRDGEGGATDAATNPADPNAVPETAPVKTGVAPETSSAATEPVAADTSTAPSQPEDGAGKTEASAPATVAIEKEPTTAMPVSTPAPPTASAPVKPEPAKSAPDKSAEQSYAVKAGDTLGVIATTHHVTVQQIKGWNALKSDIIHPGDKLRFDARDKTEPTASAAPTNSSSQAETVVADSPVVQAPAPQGVSQ